MEDLQDTKLVRDIVQYVPYLWKLN